MRLSTTMLALVCSVSMAGCVAAAGSFPEPIPGSITYNGQPRTKLKKAPVGSSFEHRFFDQVGRQVWETYVIQPDRSLLLVKRRIKLDAFDFD